MSRKVVGRHADKLAAAEPSKAQISTKDLEEMARAARKYVERYPLLIPRRWMTREQVLKFLGAKEP